MGISEEAKRFIKKMIELDPTERYSGKEAFNDP